MSDILISPKVNSTNKVCFDQQRMSPLKAAGYLLEAHGITIARATLDKYRCVGGGPRFQRFGMRILYQSAELDDWAIERLGLVLSNTSDTQAVL